MSIGECLQKHTHRQMLSWMEYLNIDADRPDKLENYLMQIAAEVRKTKAKNPRAVRIEDFKLKFVGGSTSSQEPAPPASADRVAASKSAWAKIKKNPKPAPRKPVRYERNRTGKPGSQPHR